MGHPVSYIIIFKYGNCDIVLENMKLQYIASSPAGYYYMPAWSLGHRNITPKEENISNIGNIKKIGIVGKLSKTSII